MADDHIAFLQELADLIDSDQVALARAKLRDALPVPPGAEYPKYVVAPDGYVQARDAEHEAQLMGKKPDAESAPGRPGPAAQAHAASRKE